MKIKPQQYFLNDTGIFPNSVLPVLLYKGILKLPMLFTGAAVKKLFVSNNWTNNWRGGIYTYHHYHSTTHEALGIFKGKTSMQLGGDNGLRLIVEAGDVIVIPAGVAHKNLGKEKDVTCIAGYPGGKEFDMNYGKAGERPVVDQNINAIPLPISDPVTGVHGQLTDIWKNKTMQL